MFRFDYSPEFLLWWAALFPEYLWGDLLPFPFVLTLEPSMAIYLLLFKLSSQELKVPDSSSHFPASLRIPEWRLSQSYVTWSSVACVSNVCFDGDITETLESKHPNGTISFLQGSTSPRLASPVALWSEGHLKQEAGWLHQCYSSYCSHIWYVSPAKHFYLCPGLREHISFILKCPLWIEIRICAL